MALKTTGSLIWSPRMRPMSGPLSDAERPNATVRAEPKTTALSRQNLEPLGRRLRRLGAF